MIRRNITFEHGGAGWLLISQVEHARISGEITRGWHEPFSDEIIDAVTHHDDGWAAWEASPQMDAKRGRPLSFLEMPIEDALRIWSDSIAAARRIGPLAGAIVAGHFMGLGSGSDRAAHPSAVEWLARMEKARKAWLVEWQRESPANTPDIADLGRQMLLTADLLSLWLCCDGPVASVDGGEIPNSEMTARSTAVLGKYRFGEASKSADGASIVWQGTLEPWPFAVADLNFESPAIGVPAAAYRTWPEVEAASRPIELAWHLRQTLPAGREC